LIFYRELRDLFTLKPSERLWHIPLLASVATAVPLLVGVYFDNLDYGKLACLGGLVMLYIPKAGLAERMRNIILCSFGFIVSFTIGISFSFNPYLSAIIFGIYTCGVHWLTRYLKMKPPGNFFFIMIASMASCMPFNFSTIPERIGVISMGLIFASLLVLLYGLLRLKSDLAQHKPPAEIKYHSKIRYANIYESVILGVFMFISLFLGLYLGLSNPYWIPISCLAVMQGVGTHHIWRRSMQRVVGTILGLGVSWALLPMLQTPLAICFGIFILQFFIEIVVVRQYALAVILITPMTILLAEAGSQIHLDSSGDLIILRLTHIVIGSLIGAVGGWFIYHEQLRYQADRQIRKTKIAINRKGK
jgi:uncharacterized membrane protein YccC